MLGKYNDGKTKIAKKYKVSIHNDEKIKGQYIECLKFGFRVPGRKVSGKHITKQISITKN